MTKKDLLTLLTIKKSNGGIMYITESGFKKMFLNIYEDLSSIVFPDFFTFKQKLYHYIHDDIDLKLGLCPICGNRCTFLSIQRGYSKHCSIQCSTKSVETISKIKKTNIKRYGVDNPAKSKIIQEKIMSTNLKKYGTKRATQNEKVKEKTKKTNKEKYGVEYVFQNEIIKEKIRNSTFNHYGVHSPSKNKEVLEKTRQTNLKKYGVNWPTQSKEIQDKQKETCNLNYGCDWSMQSNIVKEKSKQTNLKKYGVENPWSSPEIQEKIRKTNIKKYGTPYIKHSNLENELLNYISSIYNGQIIHNDRKCLCGKEIDIYLPNLKIGFEFNGDFWHMNPKLYESYDYNSVVKLYSYEIWNKDNNKNNMAKKLGIALYTIWEFDWIHNIEDIKKYIKNIIKK